MIHLATMSSVCPDWSLDEVLATDAAASLLLRDAKTGRPGLRTAVFHRGGVQASGADLCPPPRLNQDGNEVLADILGYTPDRVTALASRDDDGPSEL